MVTQRSITKPKFIGADTEELRAICERLFVRTDVINCEGLRMLCLRLTLMRDMDTGIVSEPSALIGLDQEAMVLNPSPVPAITNPLIDKKILLPVQKPLHLQP